MTYGLKTGGQLLGLSGLLHLVAPFVSGFASLGWIMAGIGVLYLALAAGLTRGMRWLGYIVFIMLLIGIIGGLSSIAASPVADWLLYAIVLVDAAAVLFLFIALWQSKPEPLQH